ncbi:MAG: ABC transporter permease [Betaproteobacteria bacterium]|nr:ABC transporter permease [Betaproteobacteria bacterium]
MLKLILQRLGTGLLTLWLVTILVFIGTQLLPGDVAQAVLGQSATQEAVAALRIEMGLDRPAIVRYFSWIAGLFDGDLGTSLANGARISSLIAERLPNTLLLAGLTALLVVPAAIVLGLVSAMYPESSFDRAVSVTTMFLVAVPEFLLGTLLVLIFAVKLRWLPAISYVSEFRSVGQMMQALALPVLTLSLVLLAQMARMTRSTILNILSSSYIEMAVLKGVRRHRIVFRHALVNAMSPIANVIALNLAYLVSGVVIVETIFAYPGLAKLIVDGVSSRDYPVIQTCAIIFCSAYILFILVADIAAILSNPRLRRTGH